MNQSYTHDYRPLNSKKIKSERVSNNQVFIEAFRYAKLTVEANECNAVHTIN